MKTIPASSSELTSSPGSRVLPPTPSVMSQRVTYQRESVGWGGESGGGTIICLVLSSFTYLVLPGFGFFFFSGHFYVWPYYDRPFQKNVFDCGQANPRLEKTTHFFGKDVTPSRRNTIFLERLARIFKAPIRSVVKHYRLYRFIYRSTRKGRTAKLYGFIGTSDFSWGFLCLKVVFASA